MSNYYICETCGNRNESIPGTICPYRSIAEGMIVFFDKGHKSKPFDYCKHYKLQEREVIE